jgi:hypothetical protein
MQDRDTLTALSPGAQLWLIPSLEVSTWSRRIDWYLGFQIRRALPHRRFEFGPDMRQLMESFEAPITKIPRTDQAPLMVASESLLPNHQTVVIPPSDDWVGMCHRVWKGLDEPVTRIFLPPGLTRAEFEKKWPSDAEHGSVEVVSAG